MTARPVALRGSARCAEHLRVTVTGCAVALALLVTPALATDLNSFRAQHHLPRLAHSARLTRLAAAHSRDMARRNSLDHDGYLARLRQAGSAAGENVAMIPCAAPHLRVIKVTGRACSCGSTDCAYRLWVESSGHRANMLMRGVTKYGLASAAGFGRRYWTLELGTK
jgi:uncharacterized protein YkwD